MGGFFLGQFLRNRLERPKEEKCNRQDNYPKIDSLLSKFTARPRTGPRTLARHGKHMKGKEHMSTSENSNADRKNNASSMPEPTVLLDGLAFVESPRWHEGRLWFARL
jgi:hypothetical protein